MVIEVKLKKQRKSERIACAVEPELKAAITRYALDNKVKESEAMRYILGLFFASRIEKRKIKNSNISIEAVS